VRKCFSADADFGQEVSVAHITLLRKPPEIYPGLKFPDMRIELTIPKVCQILSYAFSAASFCLLAFSSAFVLALQDKMRPMAHSIPSPSNPIARYHAPR